MMLAFVGGVIAGVNPCCLSMYPVAAGACCAGPAQRLSVSVQRAAAFAIGLAVATSVLGLLAALAGRSLRSLGSWAYIVLATVPIIMGLHLMRVIQVRFSTTKLFNSGSGKSGAFFVGLFASLMLAPCGTPLLAAVLSYAAYEGNPVYGASLLFAYGMGTGIPLLLAGTVLAATILRLERSGYRRGIDNVLGAALVFSGLYLMWIA